MGKPIVVYLDDDLDDIELMTEAFSSTCGTYDFFAFTTPIALWEFLEQSSSPPDIFIVDYNMPFSNGMELIKTLLDQEKFVTKVFYLLSTFLDPKVQDLATEHGIRAVKKPNNFEGVVSLATSICRNSV